MMRIRYDVRNLRGDLLGGLIAGIVALPLALAFGVQSGLGAAAGLYGAIATGFLAALLGGTATQVTGPTGPMTVVSASVVAIAIERAGGVESGLGIIRSPPSSWRVHSRSCSGSWASPGMSGTFRTR